MTRSSTPSHKRHRVALQRALVLVALAAGFCACGGASTQQGPRDARAAGGLPAWHPVTLTQMAYGKGGSAARAALPQDALAARGAEPQHSFADKASAHSREPRHMTKASTRSTVIVMPPPQGVVATPSPATEAQPAPAALAQITPDELQKYSAREASSAKQQQYRGGDVVVITASTLVIVLLIVLLVVLLVR